MKIIMMLKFTQSLRPNMYISKNLPQLKRYTSVTHMSHTCAHANNTHTDTHKTHVASNYACKVQHTHLKYNATHKLMCT